MQRFLAQIGENIPFGQKMENTIILPIYDDYVETKPVNGDENDDIPFGQNWRNWRHYVIGSDGG